VAVLRGTLRLSLAAVGSSAGLTTFTSSMRPDS
jgi:hypothetical protein